MQHFLSRFIRKQIFVFTIVKKYAKNLYVRLTAVLVKAPRWFLHGSIAWLTLRPGSRPRRTVKLALLHLRNWTLKRPRVKAKVLSILRHFPRLKARLRRLHHASFTLVTQAREYSRLDESLEQLTPRARMIYADLKSAVVRHQQGG